MSRYGMKTFSAFLEQKNQSKQYDFSTVLFLLPKKLAKSVYDWGVDHVLDRDVYHEDGDYGRESEMHVTVLYGIHDIDSKNTSEVLKDTKSFKVTLGKITAFTISPKYDVLKIEVNSPTLHKIHKKIKNEMDVTSKFPDYRPHVTIAYLKKGKSEKYVGNDVFDGLEFTIDNLMFSSRLGTKTPIRLNR